MKEEERKREALMEAFKTASAPHKIFAANLMQEHGVGTALRYLQTVAVKTPPVASKKYKGKRRCVCPECGATDIDTLKTSPLGRALRIHLQCQKCEAKFTRQDNHNGVKK